MSRKVLNPFKHTATVSTNEIDVMERNILAGVHQLLTKNDMAFPPEEIYRQVVSVCLAHCSLELYNNVKQLLAQHIREQLQQLHNCETNVISLYLSKWKLYFVVSTKLEYLFMYMDRNWIQYNMDTESGVGSIHELALMIWRNALFIHIKDRLVEDVLDLDKQSKNDQQINRNDIACVIESFETHGMLKLEIFTDTNMFERLNPLIEEYHAHKPLKGTFLDMINISTLQTSATSNDPVQSNIDERENTNNNSVKNQITDIYIDLSKLHVFKNKQLGRGANGAVFYAEYYKSPVAVKYLHLYLGSEDDKKTFEKEVNVLRHCKHPNVINCYGHAIDDNGAPLIMMEYLPQNLTTWINQQSNKIDLSLILKIMKGIASGMLFLHSRKIYHRDLKSNNVLLTDDLTVKLCDFGDSKIISTNVSNTGHDTLGTLPWAAPEYMTIKRLKERTEKGDVYSYGVIVWELFTREKPWQQYTPFDILNAIQNGERLIIPDNCPLEKLISDCWLDDPKKRPSFEEILEVIDHNLSSL